MQDLAVLYRTAAAAAVDHRQQRLPQLREVLDLVSSGAFSRGDRELFEPLVGSLLSNDPYMLLADFRAYVEAQSAVDAAFRDRAHWTRMSIRNVARIGTFSSDRTIRQYANEIWNAEPVEIRLRTPSPRLW